MRNHRPTRDQNVNYQRALAASLLRAMGYQAAIEFCQQNAWNGVFAAIEVLGRRQAQPDTPVSGRISAVS